MLDSRALHASVHGSVVRPGRLSRILNFFGCVLLTRRKRDGSTLFSWNESLDDWRHTAGATHA